MRRKLFASTHRSRRTRQQAEAEVVRPVDKALDGGVMRGHQVNSFDSDPDNRVPTRDKQTLQHKRDSFLAGLRHNRYDPMPPQDDPDLTPDKKYEDNTFVDAYPEAWNNKRSRVTRQRGNDVTPSRGHEAGWVRNSREGRDPTPSRTRSGWVHTTELENDSGILIDDFERLDLRDGPAYHQKKREENQTMSARWALDVASPNDVDDARESLEYIPNPLGGLSGDASSHIMRNRSVDTSTRGIFSRGAARYPPPMENQRVVKSLQHHPQDQIMEERERSSLDETDGIISFTPDARSKSRNENGDDYNIKQLRWTDEETDSLLQQLEFFGENLSTEFSHFPRQIVEQLLKSIQAVVEKDTLRRDDPLLSDLSSTLKAVQLVDFDRLLEVKRKNTLAGDCMDGKDVIVLCGSTGAGKTTTLHFLAGTRFKEVEEDGFFHLLPMHCEDPTAEAFQTSCSQKDITRTLQATAVKSTKESNVVLCDTPAFGMYGSVEEELANGLGSFKAIQRAKTVQLVVVFNRENMGNRFSNLGRTVQDMTKHLAIASKTDFKPLKYIFTKYEGRHRSLICKQLGVIESKAMLEDASQNDPAFLLLVEDMINKTTPNATIVLPMEGKPDTLLDELKPRVNEKCGSKDLFIPFARDSTLRKLKVQLQISVHEVTNMLCRGNYDMVVHKLRQMLEIEELYPDAWEFVELAKESAMRHIHLVSDIIKETIEERDFVTALFRIHQLRTLSSLVPETKKSCERAVKRLRKTLKKTIEYEDDWEKNLQMLLEISGLESVVPETKDCLLSGFDGMLKNLLQTVRVRDYGQALLQIEQLSQLAQKHPNAGECARRGLVGLQEAMGDAIKTDDLDAVYELLERVNRLGQTYPNAKECAIVGLQALVSKCAALFESHRLSSALEHIKLVSNIKLMMKKRGVPASIDLKILREALKDAIDGEDLRTAFELMLELQKLQDGLPELIRCVREGLENLLQKSANSIDSEHYSEVLKTIQDIIQVLQTIPGGDASIKACINELSYNVQKTIKSTNDEVALDLLMKFSGLDAVSSLISSGIRQGLEDMIRRSIQSMDKHNYGLTLDRIKHMGNIAIQLNLPKESMHNALDILSRAVQDLFGNLTFESSVDLLCKLEEMIFMYPRVNKTVEEVFEALIKRSISLFDSNSCLQAIEEMKQLGEVKRNFSIRDVIFSRNLPKLSRSVENAMRQLGFSEARELLIQLHDLARLFPDAKECVQVGFKVTALESVQTFKKQCYMQAVEEIGILGHDLQRLSILPDSIEGGFEPLNETITVAMRDLNFSASVELLQELNSLSTIFPGIQTCVQRGFGALFEKSVMEFDDQNGDHGLASIVELARLTQEFPNTTDKNNAGLNSLTSMVRKVTETMKFGKVLALIQQLDKMSDKYAFSRECVGAAYEVLIQRTEVAFSDNRFDRAVSNMGKLGMLMNEVPQLKAKNQYGKLVSAFKKSMSDVDHDTLASLMMQLESSMHNLPESMECLHAGIEIMWKGTREMISAEEYDVAAERIEQLADHAPTSSIADRYVQLGIKRLGQIAEKAFTNGDFQKANYLAQLLVQIDHVSAQADETVQHISVALRERLKKSIEVSDFSTAIDLMERLADVPELFPDAVELSRRSLKKVTRMIEQAMEKGDHKAALSLVKIGRLQTTLPERAPLAFYENAAKQRTMKQSIARRDFTLALDQLEEISNLNNTTAEAGHAVQVGMRLISKALDRALEPKHFGQAIELIKRLAQSPMHGALDAARRGLKALWMTINLSIERQDYSTAAHLIRQMSRLTEFLSETSDCLQLAFVALRVKLVKSIEQGDYATVTLLVEQLNILAREIPEACDCARMGFEALREGLEQTLEDKDYPLILEQIKQLTKVRSDLSEAGNFFRLGFDALSRFLTETIENGEYSRATGIIQELIVLSEERSEAIDCIRHGLFIFWNSFEAKIGEEDFGGAVSVLRQLGKLAELLPEADDGVQLGLEVLQDCFESMVERKDYDSAVHLMQYLSKLASEFPKATSCVQNGFALLRKRLLKIEGPQDYSTARHLISKLEKELSRKRRHSPPNPSSPESIVKSGSFDEHSAKTDKFSEDSEDIGSLRAKVLQRIEDRNVKAVIKLMIKFSAAEHMRTEAGDCLDIGYQAIQSMMLELLESSQYSAAVELLKDLDVHTHRLPVAGECARFGLEEFRKSVESEIDRRQYENVIKGMENLCILVKDLPEAFVYAQHVLDNSVQHMVKLREEVVASFEEAGEAVDIEVFSNLLQQVLEGVKNVASTEALREFSVQLHKKELDSTNSKCLTCTPRLCTGEAFCSEHVRWLTETENAKLPILDLDPDTLEKVAKHQLPVLGVMQRLRAVKFVLRGTLGSSAAKSAYDLVFDRFRGFIMSLLSEAEKELNEDHDLRVFEMYTSVLIMLKPAFASHRDEEGNGLEEALEHRLLKLLLRFEVKVSDCMEVLCTFKFPQLNANKAKTPLDTIRELRIQTVKEPYVVLQSVGNSQTLCDLFSKDIDARSVKKVLSSFDKALASFIEEVIARDEAIYKEMVSLMGSGDSIYATRRKAVVLGEEIDKILAEFSGLTDWTSRDAQVEWHARFERFRAVRKNITALIVKIDIAPDIGFDAFIATTVDYVQYRCLCT